MTETTLKPQKPRIAVLTPAYGDTVAIQYMEAVMDLVDASHERRDIQLYVLLRGAGALLSCERNELVAFAMAKTDCTHILWVDADQGFEPDAVYRLLNADKDVIGANIPKKCFKFPDTVSAGTTKAQVIAAASSYSVIPIDDTFVIDENGVAEVAAIGCGLTLVKRAVFEAIAKARPDLKYTPRGQPLYDDIKDHTFDFYAGGIDHKRAKYVGEDVNFCLLWRELGGKIYADMRAQVTHTGPYTWYGDSAAWVESGASGRTVFFVTSNPEQGAAA